MTSESKVYSVGFPVLNFRLVMETYGQYLWQKHKTSEKLDCFHVGFPTCIMLHTKWLDEPIGIRICNTCFFTYDTKLRKRKRHITCECENVYVCTCGKIYKKVCGDIRCICNNSTNDNDSPDRNRFKWTNISYPIRIIPNPCNVHTPNNLEQTFRLIRLTNDIKKDNLLNHDSTNIYKYDFTEYTTTYTARQNVYPDHLKKVCSSGIHYYKTMIK